MYNFEIILTKEYILKYITEEQIFQYYLEHINIETNKKIYLNTLRADSNTDCSYFFTTRLLFRDFAVGQTYSCFDIVMYKYNITYKEALTKIATDFKILKNESSFNNNISNNNLFSEYDSNRSSCNLFNQRNQTIIKIKKENWNNQNSQYWKNYHFKKSTLDLFEINPISHYWINDNIFNFKNTYSYYHGFDKIHRRTILNTTSKDFKWIKNLDSSIIQGINKLPEFSDLLIITKSYKDILIYYEHGISAIAPNSESTFLNLDVVNNLKTKFKKILLQFDSDTPNALTNCINHSNYYQIPYITIPKELNIKDISDCRKLLGVEQTNQIIQHIINN